MPGHNVGKYDLAPERQSATASPQEAFATNVLRSCERDYGNNAFFRGDPKEWDTNGDLICDDVGPAVRAARWSAKLDRKTGPDTHRSYCPA
jgi:hypothetical protein